LYKFYYSERYNSEVRGGTVERIVFSTIIQTPEAEMLLERSEIEKAIMISVEALPKKCQEIFILSKMEGLKNKEIAERLGISLKTVESQMTIAIKRLRKDLGWLLQIFIFFRLDF
jgi:RNA polymerase sigma factor, sigma-70 family